MSSLLHANQFRNSVFGKKLSFKVSTSSLLCANLKQKLSFGEKTKFQGFNVLPSAC